VTEEGSQKGSQRVRLEGIEDNSKGGKKKKEIPEENENEMKMKKRSLSLRWIGGSL
jgi:hypothetical protein